MRLIHRLARGVPRRINLLCDRALLGAYSRGDASVSRTVVAQAAREVFGAARSAESRRPAWRWVAAGAALGVVLASAAALVLNRPEGRGSGGVAVARITPPAAVASVAAASATVAMPNAVAVGATAAVPEAAAGMAASSVSAARTREADLTAPSALEALLTASWRNEGGAWRELAPAWGVSGTDADVCTAAERSGVRCFSGVRDLNLIRRLERPGILTLRARDGVLSYAILVRLTAQDATLQVSGGKTYRMPLMALASVWQGEFASLWRTPPGYRSFVVDGDAGPAVDWLAARLAELQGLPAPAAGQRLDAALKSQVRTFQVAQGLLPDGIAGPTTFMQINRATGIDEPRLPLVPAAVTAAASTSSSR